MTPKEVLAAKRPKTAAERFHKWLSKEAEGIGYREGSLPILVEGDHGWEVRWEGPFEWTMVTAGSTLYCGELGNYSTPGPFPEGLSGEGWMAEPVNHYTIGFYMN
jgi:hypothetical protein